MGQAGRFKCQIKTCCAQEKASTAPGTMVVLPITDCGLETNSITVWHKSHHHSRKRVSEGRPLAPLSRIAWSRLGGSRKTL